MRLEKQFDVKRPVEEAARLLAKDDTLTGLFPDAQTEIVESSAKRKTARTRYHALGREGVATFHFRFQANGDVYFEKVCDGKVWRKLQGGVTLAPRAGGTRVRIELEGTTRPLVPEFTIRAPMQRQLEQMATALRGLLQKRPAARRA